MKYVFRLGSNILTSEYIIPACCSRWLILKDLRLGVTPLQTHALTLNPTHSKILVVSQTNGNSWSTVKPVDAGYPNVAYNQQHIPLIMNTFTYVAILFDISSRLQRETENSLISSFKSPISQCPIIWLVLFLCTKLPCIFILSKTMLTFFHVLSDCQSLCFLVFALEYQG